MNNFGVLLAIVCIFLIHNLDGVYGDGECPSNVIDDINKQIEDALSKYPERQASSSTLSVVYYDSYENLKRAKVSAHAKQSDCDSAKKILEKFLEIAPDFLKIADRMEKAVEALSKVEMDNNTSMELKCNALSIKSAIKSSTSVQKAEAALETYEAFKQEHNIAE